MEKEISADNQEPKEQVSRRSFLEKSAIGLGALTLAATGGDALGQTQTAVQPNAGRADKNGKFANKVVLITGATSGIGAATAREFAAEGARVYFCGRRENLGQKVEREIRATGGEATYQRADVRDKRQVQMFVENCVVKYGGLDIAFNNAGIAQPPQALKEMDDDLWADMMNTNVTGIYYAMKYEVPHLEKRGGGAIINTSSAFGLKAAPMLPSYITNKFAVTGLTKSAAMELAPKNIRVNAVAPGAILDTDFGRWNKTPLTPEQIEGANKIHAANRTGKAVEIAKAVLWLASPDASFVVGEIMQVDGYFIPG